ncbi:MAG: tripartite tricarboxylate transporter substrate binding protein [Lautropia sp.]
MSRLAIGLLAATMFLQPAAGQTSASDYPSKPIRVIVPVAPGGSLDLMTRQVMQAAAGVLGQPVVVENKPGASTLLGNQFVARAPADGYTLLAVSNTFATAPTLLKDAGYDPVKDFTGVSLIVDVPLVFLVNVDSSLQDLQQLIALARTSADKVTYGSAGSGSAPHIAAAMLFLQSGVNPLHVPFKGNAPALMEVMAGRITVAIDTVPAAMPHIRSGKLRALAVTTAKRSPVLPDVPTVAEVGIPGYEVSVFNGIAAPAGTPLLAVERLHAAIAKAITPELRDRLLKEGAELRASPGPQQFTAFIRDQVGGYARVIKEVDIKAN